MAGEVPEAGFPTKASVYQHVEPVDAEESGVPLSPWENIEGGMAESDVSNNV